MIFLRNNFNQRHNMNMIGFDFLGNVKRLEKELDHFILCNDIQFKVVKNAPSTYEALCAYVKKNKRYCVYSGGSDNTIYGDKEVNYAFRAWHDFHHVKQSLSFTPEDERQVIACQVNDILALYGDTKISRECIAVLRADGIGQVKYYEKYQDFPQDQAKFVTDYMYTGIIHKQF